MDVLSTIMFDFVIFCVGIAIGYSVGRDVR